MEKVKLEATERKNISKHNRKTVRYSGRVPGIFYSKHVEPIAIEVPQQLINSLVFTAKTNLISLILEDHDEYECVIKDVQFDPVTDKILHFDLLGVTRGEKIQLDVPVQILGNAVGVKEGGILQQNLHKFDVECLPRHIPQFLNIDVTELKLGDSIHVGALSFENVTILNPEDTVVVAVTHPKVEKEVEVEEGEEIVEEEEAAEPEVIGKGKEAEEEKKEE
ncbi:MAG: 50S ribosomal protein L25 [Ignavibacterium sp.]|nr:MAG: 50S ribosomal protein L25 [Ignavibacterium sp.]